MLQFKFFLTINIRSKIFFFAKNHLAWRTRMVLPNLNKPQFCNFFRLTVTQIQWYLVCKVAVGIKDDVCRIKSVWKYKRVLSISPKFFSSNWSSIMQVWNHNATRWPPGFYPATWFLWLLNPPRNLSGERILYFFCSLIQPLINVKGDWSYSSSLFSWTLYNFEYEEFSSFDDDWPNHA